MDTGLKQDAEKNQHDEKRNAEWLKLCPKLGKSIAIDREAKKLVLRVQWLNEMGKKLGEKSRFLLTFNTHTHTPRMAKKIQK